MRAWAILLAVVAASPSPARDLSADEIGPISQVASALNASALCNFEADHLALGRFLSAKLGSDRGYDNDALAQAMFFVVGVQAMNATVGQTGKMSKSQFAKYCKDELKSFGPEGTAIQGGVKP